MANVFLISCPPPFRELSVYTPTPGLTLDQVTTYQEAVEGEQPVHKLAEVFQLNIGKPVQLVVDGKVVSGVLKGFVELSISSSRSRTKRV